MVTDDGSEYMSLRRGVAISSVMNTLRSIVLSVEVT